MNPTAIKCVFFPSGYKPVGIENIKPQRTLYNVKKNEIISSDPISFLITVKLN